jgi:hypothetical protein
MNIEIRLVFKKNTFDGKDIVENIIENNLIGYTPEIITSLTLNIIRKKIDIINHFELIKALKNDFDISFESPSFTGNSFSIRSVGFQNCIQVLNWVIEKELYEKIDISNFLNHSKFICGYAFESEFVTWQSEQSIHNYRYLGRDYTNMKIKYDKRLKEKIIDVSSNPGREVMLKELWLMASWKMWFGNSFFVYVPKQVINSFKLAYVKEENENYLYFNLYDKIEDSATSQNLELMKQFRDCCKFDELEKRLSFEDNNILQTKSLLSRLLNFFKN